MSHAAIPFPPAGNSGSANVARFLIVVAVLVAMVVAGAAMFGHSHSVAASSVRTSMQDTALQPAPFTGTDPSVPQASAVFSRGEPASEEACPTF